jgi:hypothetical protein
VKRSMRNRGGLLLRPTTCGIVRINLRRRPFSYYQEKRTAFLMENLVSFAATSRREIIPDPLSLMPGPKNLSKDQAMIECWI